MPHYFNIAGPCHPSEHYMLDPLRNFGNDLMNLIDQKSYFVIHSARQSGKTTLLKELTRKINAEQKYYALYCSLEKLQEITEPKEAIPEIIDSLKIALLNSNIPNTENFAKNANSIGFTSILQFELSNFCKTLNKPLVLFFDEADCLANGTLITFLRQLRNGYIDRPDIPFIHSLALVGMRNIRDYKARIRDDTSTLGSASPFNIVAKSMTLKNFTKDEVAQLYSQHTTETGQIFELQAIDCIYEQTCGQPWLVNAIARECVEKNPTVPLTQEIAKEAISNIILARGTHFDSLMERLKEERIRKVIQPLIQGEDMDIDKLSDDYLYAKDLGIISDETGATKPSNPIYAELIIRTLNWSVQETIKDNYADYTVPRYMKNGKIDMDFLIKDFQEFWRENSEIWIARYKKNFYQYDEAAPHLVLQAFLQRAINGGGYIIREMALGTKRADLCVVYEEQKYPIELKILRNYKSLSEGLEQLSVYMDKMGSSEGWLVLFDRDAEKPWEEKLYMRLEEYKGKHITVAGA